MNSGGMTDASTIGSSLISKVAVPDGSSNYEVRTTLTLTQSGGTYTTYLRATSNAMSGPSAAGTAYAIEVQNPTFSGSACSATLAIYKIISGSVTTLGTTTIPCSNGLVIRSVRRSAKSDRCLHKQHLLLLDPGFFYHQRATGRWRARSSGRKYNLTGPTVGSLRRRTHHAANKRGRRLRLCQSR